MQFKLTVVSQQNELSECETSKKQNVFGVGSWMPDMPWLVSGRKKILLFCKKKKKKVFCVLAKTSVQQPSDSNFPSPSVQSHTYHSQSEGGGSTIQRSGQPTLMQLYVPFNNRKTQQPFLATKVENRCISLTAFRVGFGTCCFIVANIFLYCRLHQQKLYFFQMLILRFWGITKCCLCM